MITLFQASLSLRENIDQVSPITDINVTIASFARAALIIGAIAAFFYMIWGGLDWIAAGGDSGKIESAKKKITQSVIGLVVLASVGALFLVLQTFLGINILSSNGGGGGGIGSGGSGGGGGSTPLCVVGQTYNDGGAGGYCTGGGAAIVRCNGPDQHLSYVHYDPVSCVSGSPTW